MRVLGSDCFEDDGINGWQKQVMLGTLKVIHRISFLEKISFPDCLDGIEGWMTLVCVEGMKEGCRSQALTNSHLCLGYTCPS